MDRADNKAHDPFECQMEGEYGTFQSFQKVDAHQSANTLFTARLGQISSLIVVEFLIFM